MICSSVNLDRFMGPVLLDAGLYPQMDELAGVRSLYLAFIGVRLDIEKEGPAP